MSTIERFHCLLCHWFVLTNQSWDDRDDDDIIVIERILLLIRNLLHVTADSQEEKVCVSCDIDTVI